MTRAPGIPIGMLVGALLSASVTAVAYVAHRLVGLSFVPFDVFDWLTRRLPGGLLTAGIDALVAVIEKLALGPTAAVAKSAEQMMAIAGFVLAGAGAGGLLFALLRHREGRNALATAITLGTLAGVPALWIGITTGSATAPGVLDTLWILLLLVAWGAALGWSYLRLAAAGAPQVTEGAARTEPIDRRTFVIRLGGATALLTVVGAVVATRTSPRRSARELAIARGGRRWSATNRLPNADARVQPVRGTRAELTPVAAHYRIDINTRAPAIDPTQWRLRIGGLVGRERALTIDELRAYEPMHQFVTLECISNRVAGDLISTTRWTGVSLQRLLPDLELRATATHLRIGAADGFHEVVDLATVRSDPRVMLCYDWDGLPLPTEHGFPLRIYIPDRFGMKQPKWIETIEAIDRWEPGYWVDRGWDRDAIVEATAVIDTVATDMMMPGMDAGGLIPVGGIAYAGARGISRVELQIDDGEWRRAELREPLSETTWVVWRYDWPFQPGEHTLRVRCADGRGMPQVVAPSPPHPDGATGLHRMEVML